MATKTYSYLGKGMVYLRNRSSGGGLKQVGNCSALEFSVETDTLTQSDYTQAGGGNANEIQRVSSVGASITMLELRPDNVAMALRGTRSEVQSAPVTGERHTAYPGTLLALSKTPDRTESITVTIDPDGAGDAAIEDVDYEITGAGVYVTEGGAISEGDVVAIDYTSAAADVIEAMTGSGDEYELVFDGLNEAESDRPVTVTAHRVKFSPTTGLSLIGDDFGELALDGSLLVDSSKVGAGVSRYFKVAMAR
ncbi:hypothetical protein FLM52_14520 [bacterium Scap17]|nr:hypothetical protein [bacterium Scap17]